MGSVFHEIWNSRKGSGDLVLVRQMAFKGKHKIQDKWENVPYIVLEQVDPKLPVFKVENTEDSTRVRVLHRNMLFPLLTYDLDYIQSPPGTEEDVLPLDSSDSEEDTEEPECPDPAEEKPYEGPMTRSRTKGTTTQSVEAVTKANKLMEHHFGMVTEVPVLDYDPDYPDLFAHIEAGFISIRQWLVNK